MCHPHLHEFLVELFMDQLILLVILLFFHRLISIGTAALLHMLQKVLYSLAFWLWWRSLLIKFFKLKRRIRSRLIIFSLTYENMVLNLAPIIPLWTLNNLLDLLNLVPMIHVVNLSVQIDALVN